MESLVCPRCGGRWSRVKETRPGMFNGIHVIIRIRQCMHPTCTKQFKTTEIINPDVQMPSNNRAKKQTKPDTPKPQIDTPLNPFLPEN